MFGLSLAWKLGIGAVIVLGAFGYGYDLGGDRIKAKWDAANNEAAADALYRYMERQTTLDVSVVAINKSVVARIAAINAKASGLQGELNAIRTRNPLPADCVLDDERVRWANNALGYTAADGAMR